MNDAVLTTIAITGFGVAFFHAAIPTHWLPFVLAARAQRWTHFRTLSITALAGTGHVIFTAVLGLLIAWFGIVLNERIGAWFPRIAGAALIFLGLFYLYRQFTGKGHVHHHFFCDHEDAHDHGHHHGPTPDRVAIGSLLALLTFSPCEAFLPIYASGVRYGWGGFALLTAILSVGTVAGMILFTWLTLMGVQKVKLDRLEKFESGIIGALLGIVGVLIIFVET
ncbi:MAG: hypothetical protein ACXWFY_02820 [Chthoniobacterales bacterium]